MPASSPRKARSGCGRAGSLTVTTGCSRGHRHRHDRRTEGQAVRGVHAGRCHHRSTLRRYRPWPCHHPQAGAHDGWRCDGEERAGQRLGVHRAPAGGLDAMNLPRRRFLHLAAGVAGFPVVSRIAWAQSYPTRPVRITVGFPPGQSADISARLLGQWLSDRLGQSFVIDNRPGASSSIATEFVVHAPPDGYTLLWVSTHLAGELFKMMAGVDMVHVPYRGAGPALTDLIAGQVQVYFATTVASIEYIRAGRLRALAVTTATRSDALPGIPTVDEFVPGYEASSWYGVGAPKATPAEIIEKLNKEINAGLADPKIKARLADLGGDVLALSPADFGKLIAEETEKWGTVVKFTGIKAD